jgi:hypothetical protein
MVPKGCIPVKHLTSKKAKSIGCLTLEILKRIENRLSKEYYGDRSISKYKKLGQEQ